jgi:uncharacterized protein YbcV (DUF1398 family)
MNATVIHETLAKSQAGELIFPEVVRRLMDVGVESYLCDLANGVETFCQMNGETHTEKMVLHPVTSEAGGIPIRGVRDG